MPNCRESVDSDRETRVCWSTASCSVWYRDRNRRSGGPKIKYIICAVTHIQLSDSYPQTSHLEKHVAMAHRLLTAQVMTFAQHLVQKVAEFPGGNAILLEWLAKGDRPKGLGAMCVESSDDGSSSVFGF